MHDLALSFSDYKLILSGWIGLAVVIFFILQKIPAPYGRHSSKTWGPMISNKWGWLLMELPVLLMLGFLVIPRWDQLSVPAVILVSVFTVHYINRVFVFPFRIRTKKKMMPMVIMISAVLFNMFNGFSLGYFFTRFEDYPVSWLTDPRFIAGAALFVAGMYINWKADARLIALRNPGETGYRIPEGWLFEKISCPNLLGELVEWTGYALMCWNLPALAFLIWTGANLVPRASAHHKWYKNNFKEYPAGRKAIIPHIY